MITCNISAGECYIQHALLSVTTNQVDAFNSL